MVSLSAINNLPKAQINPNSAEKASAFQKTDSFAFKLFNNIIRKPLCCALAIPIMFIAIPLTGILLGAELSIKYFSGKPTSVKKTALFAFTFLLCPLQIFIGNTRNRQTYRFKDEIFSKADGWGSLTLGSIPTNGDFSSIKKTLGENGLVLDLTDPEERVTTLIGRPITQKEWEKAKITYLNKPAPDFLPLSLQLIDEAVEKMHEAIANGHNVYIHCKAGVGRSATIASAYLAKYGTPENKQMSSQEAIDYVKNKRSVNLHSDQQAQVHKYAAMNTLLSSVTDPEEKEKISGEIDNARINDDMSKLKNPKLKAFKEALSSRVPSKRKTIQRSLCDKADLEHLWTILMQSRYSDLLT